MLLARGLLRRSSASVTQPEGHTSTFPLPFELCSQVFRALALGLTVVAAVRHGTSWANVVLLAYAFVLGIARLRNDVHWRRVLLHQVNFTLAGAWLVFAAGELLPAADAGVDFTLPPVVFSSVATLTLAVLLALVTPREWVPPSLELDVSGNVAARGPSPEETCSWLDYYVTYECKQHPVFFIAPFSMTISCCTPNTLCLWRTGLRGLPDLPQLHRF